MISPHILVKTDEVKSLFKQVRLKHKIRLRFMYGVFVLFALALIGKLFHVQIIQHKELTKRAEQNWDIEVPFGYERGELLDRQGRLIVGNEVAPTLYFVPAQNNQIEQVAEALAPYLKVEKKALLEKLNQKEFMVKLAPEGKNISKELAEDIMALNIPGLYANVDFVRHYPHGELLSRLIGFTGGDHQGLAGIEYAYDRVLKGYGDRIRLYTDAKGNTLPHVEDGFKRGKKGASVQLTIDVEIQKVVERELSQAMKKYEATQALAIVMDPNSGAILSLASYPTYHPEKYQQQSSKIYNRNLPVWMTFEPGSTFKIITLAASLNEELIELEDEHFHDPGFTVVANARLRCWKREGHGEQTFLEVVENSCNPGFVEMGRRLGGEKLDRYIRDFGFGESTGSGIAGESPGILFSEEAFGPVEQATTAFGQGISVTPIQQVQAVAAAVNGGTLYQPYIVDQIINANGKVTQQFEPVMKRKVIEEEASAQVRKALESVVANGSGRGAYVDGLRVAGKTGTAQKAVDGAYKEGEYIVSFIGFAPADDPELLVYVAVDSPKNAVQFGGVIAAPMVGNIIEETAPIMNITRREKQLEKEYQWGDELTFRVPDLVGMSKTELQKQLYPYAIEWHGNGKKVKDQLPASGYIMNMDETIHVYSD